MVSLAIGGITPGCVTGQKHDILGMPAHLLVDGVVDEVERVRGACVLGDRLIVQVDFTRHGIKGERSPARCRSGACRHKSAAQPWREVDDLGVAAVLEVEDAIVAPAVLVVADQSALRIRRQRCLARSRQAEEERGIAILADVCRAVHGHDALQRQQVVENREDGLLDLAGVGRVADQADAALEADDDERVACRAVNLRDCLEGGQ